MFEKKTNTETLKSDKTLKKISTGLVREREYTQIIINLDHI